MLNFFQLLLDLFLDFPALPFHKEQPLPGSLDFELPGGFS